MSAVSICDVHRINGVAMCRTHHVKMVDRPTLESLRIPREHPPVGNMFCPVSGQGFDIIPEVDEILDSR